MSEGSPFKVAMPSSHCRTSIAAGLVSHSSVLARVDSIQALDLVDDAERFAHRVALIHLPRKLSMPISKKIGSDERTSYQFANRFVPFNKILRTTAMVGDGCRSYVDAQIVVEGCEDLLHVNRPIVCDFR